MECYINICSPYSDTLCCRLENLLERLQSVSQAVLKPDAANEPSGGGDTSEGGGMSEVGAASEVGGASKEADEALTLFAQDGMTSPV